MNQIVKFLRCVGVQEKAESVAADEMAVKKKAADTNFLEKKIGFQVNYVCIRLPISPQVITINK